jgi:RNA polymerase sigma-70 factor (ECF subfamily)
VLRAVRESRLLRRAQRQRQRKCQRRCSVCPNALWMPMMGSSALSPATSPAIDWSLFYERLAGYVAARVRSPADADDLVQLILERAMAKSGTAQIDNVAGWLFGIARNAIADHHRARARTLLLAAQALENENLGELGSSDEERSAVLACMEPLLRCLPDATAQLLRWADMEGRSMQAIADELGITLTATKSRVQRARKDFLELTSACCAVTIDARGRVTDLTPRKTAQAIECECPDASANGKRSRS